jgi:transposase
VTQDGRAPRRYKRRFTVERMLARLQHLSRLCIRSKKSTVLFQIYRRFACSLMSLRGILG